MSESEEHLWQATHSYYCQAEDYYAGAKSVCEWDTWAAFVEGEGESDMDYNLLFRWDWRRADDEDSECEGESTDRLFLFFMGQRKGKFRSVMIGVTEADEPAVRDYLAKRWEHLRGLWEPVASVCK